MSEPDWYRAPAAESANESIASWQPTAADTVGFWPRALARILDGVIAFGVATAAEFLAASIRGAGLPLPVLPLDVWPQIFFSLATSTVMEAVAESVGGATPGKLLLGFRVRMVDGRMCTFGAALKRAVLYIWDALFFAMIAYSSMSRSPLHQRVGDRWGGTIVVRNRAIPANAQAGQRAILGALAMLGFQFVSNLLTP